MNLLTFNPLVEKIVKTSIGAKRTQKIDEILSKIPLINFFFDTFIISVKKSNSI